MPNFKFIQTWAYAPESWYGQIDRQQHSIIQKVKGKEADLYSAFIEVPYTQGAQVRTVADPGFPNGGGQRRGAAGAEVERRRREDRGAEGAEGGGVSPENFLIFHLKKSEFQCIMESILSQFSCPFYSKKQCFWLPELAKERANGKTTVGNNICMK